MVETAVETALVEWHPIWFILAATYFAAIFGLWRLGKAYISLVARFVQRQEADAHIKRELVAAFLSLKMAIKGALDELED